MESLKIVKINEKSNDAKRFNPTEVLEEALREYKSGELTGSKIMIVCLDDLEDNDYRIYRRMGGMTGSEARAALEAANYLLLKEIYE